MISYEDQDETDNEDACAQPVATLVLAFGLGSVLGALGVLSRLFYPYRIHRLRRP